MVENRRDCCDHRAVGLEVFVKDGNDVVTSCGVFTTREKTYYKTCNSQGNVVEILKRYNADTYKGTEFSINLGEMYVYGQGILEGNYANNVLSKRAT